MTIKNILTILIKMPKRIFLIDSIGAFMTAFLLFTVLKTWHTHIGMPSKTLSILSCIALGFSIYSALCFAFFNTKKWKLFLKIIATSNLLYCCFTLGLLIFNFTKLTAIGLIYFGGEIIIICLLAFLEFSTLKTIKRNKIINH